MPSSPSAINDLVEPRAARTAERCDRRIENRGARLQLNRGHQAGTGGSWYLQHKPIVVLSACAFSRDRERAFAAGCDVFLPKPCSPRVLFEEIGRLLAARRRTPAVAPDARADVPARD